MKAALVLSWLALAAPFAAAAEFGEKLRPGATVAFLGLGFIDSSTEGAYNGVRPDEMQRRVMLEDQVRARFADEGFDLVPLDPVAEDLANTLNPADCAGCDVRFGVRLDADYVLVGEVQKVSNLILSMNLVLRDTASGQMIRGKSVDIRSNTDESWQRGMNYILKTHYFNP
ncbi:MAG: DUF3280 domain-containing protein [Albidovulum sp.]|uniref:DUF3280 domain-containing protein n=1 Tax=Albidovulum sp. TaxID=1872424 RepID=UPI003C8343E7